MKNLLIATVLLLTTACTAQFTKTGENTFSSYSANCNFAIYTTSPNKPFDEVGIIEFQPVFMVGFPSSIAKVRNESAPLVCANGGDGLLVWESNGMGQYLKATIIRFKS